MSMAAYLTNAGLTVLNKVMAANGPLNFVKAELGSGVVTGETACRARTSLANKVADASLVSARYEGGEAKISIQYRNTGLTQGFFVNEIGLYVQDPDSSALVLYCYATFGDGTTPDWIAPASSADYTRTYDIVTIVSNVSAVTVTVSPSVLITREEFEAQLGIVDTTLLTIATENDQVNRDMQQKVDAAVHYIDTESETLDGKIDHTASDIRGEMAQQKTEINTRTDQHDENHETAMLAIIAAYDTYIRDLQSRLAIVEAQLAALTA